MATSVVTRFPPSPTGFLHIGGARTALFNWLYAKANGGKMVLRIEDTDRERSTKEAIDAIMDGLKWLELDWDGEPVFQASRAQRHIEVANQMLEAGDAYYCYCSQEELQTMRETARAQGRAVVYDGTWRDRPQGDAPEGIKPVLRFKSPNEGQTIIADQVQGDVNFANQDLDDLILLRSDGSPTYNLAVIVDDHDMGITHIMRGVDHLTNAARQSVIYNALGWDIPTMAHIPLIHGPDGAKLSKRHGALGVEAYRAMGYLPAAMRNYLSRLGWSHGDEEIFSTEQAIKWFGFDAIGKSASRFDFDKLENLNGHYIRQMDDAELMDQLHKALAFLPNGPDFASKLTEQNQAVLLRSLPVLKERAKTLVELVDSAHFVVASRPLPLDEKSQDILKNLDAGFLQSLHLKLNTLSAWNHDSIKDAVKSFADEKGLKLGKVAPALRAALTGATKSPGIFDVLEVLGQEESISRLSDQI